MQKAAGYLRLSHEDSVKRGVSFDKQKSIIEKCAAEQGYVIIEWYSDEAISGAKVSNRPGFKRMWRDLSKFRAVFVYEWSRLTRDYMNDRDFIKFRWDCEDKDIELLSATQPHERGTLQFNIEQTLATDERVRMARRIKDSMWNKARKGEWCGGPTAYGYINKEKKLVQVHDEAVVVKLIYTKFSKFRSYLKTVEYLNSRSIKTRRGKLWTTASLKRILKDPIYMGQLSYGRRAGGWTKSTPVAGYLIYKGGFEPIIDEKTFLKIKSICASIKHTEQRKPDGKYLLTGLIYCGDCGRKMYGYRYLRKTKSGLTEHLYYRCMSNARYGKIHKYRCFLLPEIEEGVWNAVLGRVNLHDIDEDDFDELSDDSAIIENLRSDLTKRKKRREKFLSLYAENIIPASELAVRVAEEDKEIESIESEIHRLEFDQSAEEKKRREPLIQKLKDCGEEVCELSFDDQRDILLELVKKITVSPDGAIEVQMYDI